MSNTVIPLDLQRTILPEQTEHALMNPDARMVILTWITFFLLLGILYKFAWKPILKALDEREESLRRAVDDADRVKEEMVRMNETRRQLIHEAELKSREIIDEARKAATRVAHALEQRAKEEAGILLETARRDIQRETEKARMILREESARLAVDLAGKLIEKNLDSETNRKLVRKLMVEV